MVPDTVCFTILSQLIVRSINSPLTPKVVLFQCKYTFRKKKFMNDFRLSTTCKSNLNSLNLKPKGSVITKNIPQIVLISMEYKFMQKIQMIYQFVKFIRSKENLILEIKQSKFFKIIKYKQISLKFT